MKIKISVALLCGLSLSTLQGQTVKDIDGNVYRTVKIGNQTWMAENLKTTRYNDGSAILLVTDNSAWVNRDSIALTKPAYFLYNNDTINKGIYGSLYNAYTVMTGKLCPAGWHVPANSEWSELTTWLGGENVAGGKMKESGTSHWEDPNYGATNESGFNALPGGYRSMDGSFKLINGGGNWWSSTDGTPDRTWMRGMNNAIDFIFKAPLEKPFGASVRCLKD